MEKLTVPSCVQFHGTGSLTTGSGDQLYIDKTTKNWRRWVYHKQHKKIPDLCVDNYGNRRLIEKIESTGIAISSDYKHLAAEQFQHAMKEASIQLENPRSDSADALDRLGEICLKANQWGKAITCFEYSLHMRKLMFGEDTIHEKTLQSLVYLGTAWAEYENIHRSIIVFEKALEMAKSLARKGPGRDERVAEILHNLGCCWERLHEHHTALSCYEKSEKIRRRILTPTVCQQPRVNFLN
ncbi:uncharacterized protein LOC120331929 [Styela clava]